MRSKYRIYFESYEQAIHFLIPSLLSVDPEASYDLVSISRIKPKSVISSHIAPALTVKNPDALFTKITDIGEIGFAWIEVSTAVDTQDHDLQRFDSIVAASLAKIPFIKVWARRTSSSDHGGQTNYDLEQSLKLAWQSLNSVAIEVEWPLNHDSTRAIRNPEAMASPKGLLTLPNVLETALDGLGKFGDPNYFFKNFSQNKYKWITDKITSYLVPMTPFNPRNTTRLFKKNNRWHLKFNRWGHAMDPERGMCWYFSNRIGQRLVGTLNDPNAFSASQAATNFKNATGIDVLRLVTLGPHQIDQLILSSDINRSGRAILINCDQFDICDSSGNLLLSLKWSLSTNQIPQPKFSTAPITKLFRITSINEDDVTYAVACLFYPCNGFSIHSVSYPGAQGDFALVQGNGRAALRTYIDVIALKKENNTIIISLTESKGARTPSSIAKDIDKVSEWKSDSAKHDLLVNALNVSNQPFLLTSVAFPGHSLLALGNASSVDFFVTVSNSEWIVWPKGGQKLAGMSKLQGSIDLIPKWGY